MKPWLFAAVGALALSAAAPAMADDAPFGCEARAGSVCYFRLFMLPRFGRVVVLPAGMKVKIPGLNIGKDSYCVGVGATPTFLCKKKLVDAKYNS
jgi:hypothetical protein